MITKKLNPKVDYRHGVHFEKIKQFRQTVLTFQEKLNLLPKREHHFVIDCKVHSSLTFDDVLSLMGSGKFTNAPSLTPEIEERLRDEFSDMRLIGIFDHCCEMELYYFIDFVKGCAHTDYYKDALKYAAFVKQKEGTLSYCEVDFRKNINGTYRVVRQFSEYDINRYEAIYASGASYKDLVTKYESTHANEIEELKYLKSFNPEDIRLVGRSGGWVTFAKYDKYEGYFDYYEECGALFHIIGNGLKLTNTNQDFYKYIYEHMDKCGFGFYSGNKVSSIETMVDYYTERINFDTLAIDYLIAHVKGVVSNFDEVLIGQLSIEIQAFLENDMYSLSEKIEKELLKIDTVHLLGSKLITSQNAKVEAMDVVNVLKKCSEHSLVGEKIGNFAITEKAVVNETTYYKIGCHVVSYEQVVRELSKYAKIRN